MRLSQISYLPIHFVAKKTDQLEKRIINEPDGVAVLVQQNTTK